MRIDLHTHSIYSDGADTPEMMVARAKAIGLDGMAITDHNTTKGWKRTIDAGKRLGVVIVPGQEISLRKGKKKVGEILALFLEKEITKNQLSQADDIIDDIRKQDGISVIPHLFNPFWWRMEGTEVITTAGKKGKKVDAIEVINGMNTESDNRRSDAFATKHGYAKTAGSDAHIAMNIGKAYTICDTNDVEEFRKCIKKKQTFVMGTQRKVYELLGDIANCKIRRALRF